MNTPARRTLRAELSLGLAVLVSLGILITGFLLYQRQRHDLQGYLGMSLMNIARTAALFLDGDAHRAVVATRDKLSPAYQQLRRTLDRVRAENQLADDVYTLQPVSETLTRFIVITNDTTRVGEDYRLSPETVPLVRRVVREGVSLSSPLYTNEHGRWITAFAPVRDRQGQVVAVLDVDYRADVFWEGLRGIRRRILGFSLAGALAALAAGLWYARRLARPLEGMAQQAREVAAGDLSRRLPVTGVRELADLAGSLNRMAAQLQAQLDALQRAHLERTHADRLASLGAVAAEVAHEMNQPLTAIQGISQGILDQSSDLPAETRQYLRVVVEEARRLRDLSQRLRDFSRRSRGELLPADLNEIVRGACLLIGPAARGRGLVLRQELAPDLPKVVADRQALEQVVLNLLVNAVHAVDGRREPRIVVRTGLAGGPGTPDLEIRVADNGPGIPAEILPNIFEPFFSTKESSGGTGLGLPISLEIVERHGGTIRVETSPDTGSCFRVCLPQRSVLAEERSLRSTGV